MKAFMDQDFMLYNETAKKLFHTYAEKQPILDYHCHLSAKEIYENRPAQTIAELWLGGDHYKWRAMRANGVPEEKITGSADGYEKFAAFAETLTNAIGNPLYHWAHLELQRYFGIDTVLNAKTAPEIWKKANAVLADGKHTPQYFIQNSNVYALCTTEDPADDLQYHALLAQEKGFATKVLPALRPDNALSMEQPSWREYLKHLAEVSGVSITDFESLKAALTVRMDEFARHGCVASDHGMEYMPYQRLSAEKLATVFADALAGKMPTQAEIDGYKTELLLWLGKEYYRRGWAMELHVGAMRSVNTRMVDKIGPSTGYDSVCDHAEALALGAYLNALDANGTLPKTVLFCLSEVDNIVLSTMIGNFQDDTMPSKMQFGTAWWFQDHVDGMEKQMRDLANEGLLGHFIGMLTDSRSFLSYPRHEYFRRILCNLIGEWVEKGQYPNDEEALGTIVENISFQNARRYFGA
ncbi:MAG: glucuronate isomerase [Ruthenibacterium sp.]